MIIFALTPLVVVAAAAGLLDGTWRQLGVACEKGLLTSVGARIELSFRTGTTATTTTVVGTKATHRLRTSLGAGNDEGVCETSLTEKWQLEGKAQLVMSETQGSGKILGAKTDRPAKSGAQCAARVNHTGVRRREFKVDGKRLTLFAADIYRMGTNTKLALCAGGRTKFIYERTGSPP